MENLLVILEATLLAIMKMQEDMMEHEVMEFTMEMEWEQKGYEVV